MIPDVLLKWSKVHSMVSFLIIDIIINIWSVFSQRFKGFAVSFPINWLLNADFMQSLHRGVLTIWLTKCFSPVVYFNSSFPPLHFQHRNDYNTKTKNFAIPLLFIFTEREVLSSYLSLTHNLSRCVLRRACCGFGCMGQFITCEPF